MYRLLAVMLLLWLVAPAALAAKVAGVEIPDTARLSEAGPELKLNGAGVRKKLFVKVYVAALYLPEKAGAAPAVIAQSGPKRVSMHMLYSEVSREKLADGWNEGFASNHTGAEMERLRGRLERFNGLFETVREGEVIHLDYLPGTGTRVTIRGQVKGIVPGKDFYDGLLNVWLGEKPATRNLKKAMLGH